jgi:hypothetical protein
LVVAQITEGMQMYKESDTVQLAALERMARELDDKQPAEEVDANRETFGMSGSVEVVIQTMLSYSANTEIQARLSELLVPVAPLRADLSVPARRRRSGCRC